MATIHPAHENFNMVFNIMLGIKKAVDSTLDIPLIRPTTKDFHLKCKYEIAPYSSDRNINRELISKVGGYIEVFVNTPLEICEERDSKGLYKLAREGKIKEFTGISDPYEDPKNADILVNSDGEIVPQNLVDIIFNKIIDMGYISK